MSQAVSHPQSSPRKFAERRPFDRLVTVIISMTALRRVLCLVLATGSLAIVLAACSSTSSGTPSGGALTCKGGTSPGPESVECDTCGATNCPMQHSAVTSQCASMVTCIQNCTCDSSDTCLDGCVSAATSNCQTLINTYADCEKQASACSTDCSD